MTEKTDDATVIAAGGVLVLGFLVLLAVGVVWGGFVLQQLWNWFAAPFSPVKLSLGEAVGVSALINAVKGVRRQKSEDDSSFGKTFSFVITWTGLLLLIGYVAHFFVS